MSLRLCCTIGIIIFEFLTVTSTTLGHEKLTQIIVDMHFWHCYERFMYQSIFIIARVDEHTLKYYDAEES